MVDNSKRFRIPGSDGEKVYATPGEVNAFLKQEPIPGHIVMQFKALVREAHGQRGEDLRKAFKGII